MKRLRITRRHLPLLASGLLAAPATLRAAEWPDRPLRLIVPFTPGGITDIASRLMAEAMSGPLGRPVVIENRPGAGGNIGMAAAIQAEPDGYTLFHGTVATHAINPVIYPEKKLDPMKDLAALGLIGSLPNVLLVNPKKHDIRSVAELVAMARAKPDQLTFGSFGSGSSSHFTAELLNRQAGMRTIHVPYRGSAPAMTALIAGETDFSFDSLPTAVPHIRAGAVRALAVTSAQRAVQLPDVPTMQEAGVADYDFSLWMGLFTQSRVPAPILARLRDAMETGRRDPRLRVRLTEQGVTVSDLPAAELDAFLARDVPRLSQAARDLGLKAD